MGVVTGTDPSGSHGAMRTVSVVAAIGEALAPHGLIARGGFHPAPEDGVPALPGGTAAATVVMVGNAGPEMWRHFCATPEYADGAPDPLDRWTRRVLTAMADEFGARPVFPSEGPPYPPMQRWAMRAEPVHASPLGLLIHPDYGLWHAYRGALVFADILELPPRIDRPSPCDSCVDRPCLGSCPVNAFRPGRYDVPACARHIDTRAGADCMELGCRARRACPAGRPYVYLPAQAEFHMLPFRRNALARLESQ